MFIIFFFFWLPLFIFIFLFFTALPTTRHPLPVTRYPRPATRLPATRHPPPAEKSCLFTSMRDSCIRRVRPYVCWTELGFYWAIPIQIYIYTHLKPIFILRIAFEQSLCFLIASHTQTEKTNRINGLYTFCKVWTFKSHLISDYSNYCSSSSSHSPFSVSDKTSDESDTTTGSSRVAAIIDYMHGRVWICNASCRHLESCRVTRLFPFIHDRWPCLSLDKKTYGGGGEAGEVQKKKSRKGKLNEKKFWHAN